VLSVREPHQPPRRRRVVRAAVRRTGQQRHVLTRVAAALADPYDRPSDPASLIRPGRRPTNTPASGRIRLPVCVDCLVLRLA
jgi:hypothetical protein